MSLDQARVASLQQIQDFSDSACLKNSLSTFPLHHAATAPVFGASLLPSLLVFLIFSAIASLKFLAKEQKKSQLH